MFFLRRKRFAELLSQADLARDEGRPEEAAARYEQCLALRPQRGDLEVQCGHMYKEAGRFRAAERHYRAALALLSDDADLALQLGHFYKILGRHHAAKAEYRRSLALKPGGMAARAELDRLTEDGSADEAGRGASSARATDRLVPTLAPREPRDLIVAHGERIEVLRLGRREAGPWGIRRTLRGVEAVHGFVLAETAIVEVQIVVNAMRLSRAPMRGGYPIEHERDRDRIAKYVFNHWVDFSVFASGLHTVELRFVEAGGGSRSWHDTLVIADPVPDDLYPDSDVITAPPPDDSRSLEAAIRARPSRVHQARRMLFPHGVSSILVTRTDQLGDLVASIPALRRLREIVPGAHVVGLLDAANSDLAGTLTDLFDEVIAIDFPDLPGERRRVMPLDQQEALRARLAPYCFDIALDLSRSPVSRELLRLSGARFLCGGGGGGEWPFLSLNLLLNTSDRWNSHDRTPHSVQVRTLVEALGAALAPPAPVLRRDDLSRDRIERFGIGPGDRYVVLHLGARIGFARWPHYAELARLLLRDRDLKIVALTEDQSVRAAWPAALLDHPRVRLVDQRLAFDDLDALLSFATAMVGNDSGPKHLAALRGTPVVTIFSSRINWTEWGQEQGGVVITRRLPCAGCAIFHEPENCGQDFACITDIRPDEVFVEVARLIGSTPA